MLSIFLILCSFLSLGANTNSSAGLSPDRNVQVDDVQQGTGTGH